MEEAMKKTLGIPKMKVALLGVACVALAGMLFAGSPNVDSTESVEVTSCDGQTKHTFATETEGQVIASALMDQWERDNPERDWVSEEKERHKVRPPADNSHLLKDEQGVCGGRLPNLP
jgi:hypothetical protein